MESKWLVMKNRWHHISGENLIFKGKCQLQQIEKFYWKNFIKIVIMTDDGSASYMDSWQKIIGGSEVVTKIGSKRQ